MIRNRNHARLAMLLGESYLVHPQTRRAVELGEFRGARFRDAAHAVLFQAGVAMRDLDEAAVRRGLAAMGRRR